MRSTRGRRVALAARAALFEALGRSRLVTSRHPEVVGPVIVAAAGAFSTAC